MKLLWMDSTYSMNMFLIICLLVNTVYSLHQAVCVYVAFDTVSKDHKVHKFCYYLHYLQKCMTFFPTWNTKGEILKNIPVAFFILIIESVTAAAKLQNDKYVMLLKE